MTESKLIFIVSQPRAGSTLLQKLLSNNTYVDTVSEPWLLLPLLGIYTPGLHEARYNYPVALRGFFDYLDKMNAREEFRKELKSLILGLYKVGGKDQFFVDKTPRYYEILPQMMELLPGAKFLVLKRNLFASLYSMLSTWTGGNTTPAKLATFYRDFLAAPFLLQDFCVRNKGKSNVLEVKYETIVAQPDKSVEEIYNWLGIPYDSSVLDLERNEKVKGIFGDDVYKKAPLPGIKASLADSWRESLSNRKLVDFYAGYQKFLTPGFITEYGYSPEEFKTGASLFRKDEFGEYVAELKKNGKI